jgi:2'-5' RNA ligase
MPTRDPSPTPSKSVTCINRGVALLPDESFSSSMIQLQRDANALLPIEPRLSLTGNLPHVTLVQGQFSGEADFERLLQEVEQRWSQLEHKRLIPTRIVYQPRGWIFLEIEKTTDLDSLHRGLADIAATYLIPPQKPSSESLGDYTGAQRESFARYGYRYMYDCFYPHLTLGRTPREPTTEDIQRLHKHARDLGLLTEFAVSTVSAYEMGPHGAHAATVLSRPLT